MDGLVNVAPQGNEQQDTSRNGCKSLQAFPVFAGILVLAVWGAMILWFWQWSAVSPLFLIPIIFLVAWWNRNRQSCDLNFVMSNYFRGFWAMSIIALLFQMLAMILVFFVFELIFYLFYKTHALTIPFSIITYVCIEEYLKLYFSDRSRLSYGGSEQITKVHIIGATSQSLGYATFQGLLWLFIFCIIFDRNLNRNWILDLIIAAVIVALIGLPMHILTGYLIGLELTRNVRRKLYMPSVGAIFKIIYLFLLWMAVGYATIWSFVVCIFGLIGEYIALILYIKRVEKTLPFEYLERVGQLEIFGLDFLSIMDTTQLEVLDQNPSDISRSSHSKAQSYAVEFASDVSSPVNRSPAR